MFEFHRRLFRRKLVHAEEAEEDDEADPVGDDDGQAVGRHPGVRTESVQGLHLCGRHQDVDRA